MSKISVGGLDDHDREGDEPHRRFYLDRRLYGWVEPPGMPPDFTILSFGSGKSSSLLTAFLDRSYEDRNQPYAIPGPHQRSSPRLVPNRPETELELVADVVEDDGSPRRIRRYLLALLAKCIPVALAVVPATVVAVFVLVETHQAWQATAAWAFIAGAVRWMIARPTWPARFVDRRSSKVTRLLPGRDNPPEQREAA